MVGRSSPRLANNPNRMKKYPFCSTWILVLAKNTLTKNLTFYLILQILIYAIINFLNFIITAQIQTQKNLLGYDEIGFIMQPVQRGISDLVQFQPSGQFSALLIQQTYRQLGIVGKKINEELFLVSLNIVVGKNSSRNLDRLREGLGNSNLSNKFMVAKSTEDGCSADIEFKSEVKFVRNPARFSSCKLHGKTMCVPFLPQTTHQLWKNKFYLSQIFNYFGNLAAINIGVDYGKAMKKFQLVSSFNCVEISFWQGLFLPTQVYRIVLKLSKILEEQSLPWIAVSVYGFQNGLMKSDARDDFFTIVLLQKGQYVRFSSESDGRGNENTKVIQGQLF
eukprot:TRINITY_DN7820_c0_g1_i3.p1 TRINITY_DN7820_c0_g1~~TRINITY_DN7820_c0_g1_i3.p1  ORF type:complete len:335 (+),score=20.34 TRINITY_DN7820_c0_g1_i3:68-1072(+)